MKILFFNYEFPPLGGGAANANSYIFKEFAKIPEIEIDFITSSINNNYHLEKIGEKIRIHRIPIGKNGNNLHYQSQKELLVYGWKAYKFAKKLIGESKTGFDFSHSFFTVPCGYISYLLKKKYGIPYIVSLRGSDVPGYSERFTLIYKILTPLIVKIWKNASRVISNSVGLKELALKSNPQQEIGIIYNGIEISEFKPDFEKRSSTEFITICVSRLTQRKGINYLIEAVSFISKEYPQIRLWLIGEGDQEENLKALAKEKGISDKIKFWGRIKHEKLPEYYQKSNVFILPSLNEGMSNTMLEALSSGLPLIATDTGGTRELMNENENGFLVQMKNSKDIAEKIILLLENRKLEKNMSESSRKKAEEMSWNKVAKKYFEIYQNFKNEKNNN